LINISLTKITAIFLSVALIAGTIVSISSQSSFIINAQAQSYNNEMDNNNYEKSYGNNNYYESQYPSSYQPSYKPQYQLYEKGNYHNYKSTTKDSSKSVSINKLKCINTNININGVNSGDIYVGNKHQVESSASSFGNYGERYNGYYDVYNNNKKDKGFDCIINNNNNNTNINRGGGNPTIPPEPEPTDNNVYVVWEDNTPGNYEIFFAVSRDGGQTFNTPKNLSNNIGASVDPQITSEGNNVYVVWKDNTPSNNDIFFAVSRDGGQTFSTPKNISETTAISERPQISAEGNNVYVVWQDNTPGILEIFFAVSDDNGLNFNSRNLSNDAGESENPQISSEGNNVYVVWRDTASEDSDIFFAVSTNNGLNFSTPKNLSNTGSAGATQISSEGNNVNVVWQDVAFGNNDIFIAVSGDNGQTFNTPKNLSNNIGASVDPQITSEGNNVYVVWQDNTPGTSDIFFAVSNNNGLNFSTPKNISDNEETSSAPQISSEGNNVNVVWVDYILGNSYSDIFFAVSNNNGLTFSTPENIIDNAQDSFKPQISSEGNNVYVVWRNDFVDSFDIFFAVSTNNGHTFSIADNLRNNTGTSENPQISSSVS
jgi:hypothetical protein